MSRLPTNQRPARSPSPEPAWDWRALAGFVAAPLLGLAGAVGWALSVADRLPDPLATHFGVDGAADGFGGLTAMLVVVAAVTVPMTLLMGLLGSRRRNPRLLRRTLGPASPVFAGFMCGTLPDTLIPQLDAATAEGASAGWAWSVGGSLAGLAVGAATALLLTAPASPPAPAAPDASLPRGPRSEPVRARASTGVMMLLAAWLVATVASLWIFPALALLLALSAVYLVQTYSVRLRVDDDTVRVRALIGEDIPLEAITAARPSRYDWGDSGGIGIRSVGYPGARGTRIAVAPRSGEALDIDTTGTNWTVVVPDGTAEGLAGDINARLDALPRRR